MITRAKNQTSRSPPSPLLFLVMTEVKEKHPPEHLIADSLVTDGLTNMQRLVKVGEMGSIASIVTK